MKKATLTPNLFTTILMACMAVTLATTTVEAGTKVTICHIPPGNPSNFHTITVNEKAVQAHLAHGDLLGACGENCEFLCDDANPCTIDACDPGTEVCSLEHPPVDCDDSNLCTFDSCDPLYGCMYAPIVCDDGDLCTIDICNPLDGQCSSTAVNCGPTGLCDPATGNCFDPCDGVICEPIDQCHEPGNCVFPGDCLAGNPLPDGTQCDDGDAGTIDDHCADGVCAGTPSAVCPCFDAQLIDTAPYSPWDEIPDPAYPFEYVDCMDEGGITSLRTKAWHPGYQTVHSYRAVVADSEGWDVCLKKECMHCIVEQVSIWNPDEVEACRQEILQSEAWAQHCQ